MERDSVGSLLTGAPITGERGLTLSQPEIAEAILASRRRDVDDFDCRVIAPAEDLAGAAPDGPGGDLYLEAMDTLERDLAPRGLLKGASHA